MTKCDSHRSKNFRLYIFLINSRSSHLSVLIYLIQTRVLLEMRVLIRAIFIDRPPIFSERGETRDGLNCSRLFIKKLRAVTPPNSELSEELSSKILNPDFRPKTFL